MPDHVDKETVRHVAKLARIRVADDEVDAIAEQLTKILGYVAVLDEVDTSDVTPTTPAVSSPDTLRADLLGSGLESRLESGSGSGLSWSSQEALDNAPDQHENFIRVPKVLDQGDA